MIGEEASAQDRSFLLLKGKKYFVIEQVDHVNRAIRAAYRDVVDDWALHDRLHFTSESKLINFLPFNHIPKLKNFAASERKLVHISHRVHHLIKTDFTITKLMLSLSFSGLNIEEYELVTFSKREDDVSRNNELEDSSALRVASSVLCVPVHLVPGYNLIGILERSVNESGWSGLQISDLLCDEAGHEH